MYKCLVDKDSFIDSKVLDMYQVLGSYEEKWEGDDTLQIIKVLIPDDKVQNFIEETSSKWIQEEWFALVWNEKEIFVIFKNKAFLLKNSNPWDKKELEEVISYGESHLIDKKYFLNMRNPMSSF